jgi:hypothetical protein
MSSEKLNLRTLDGGDVELDLSRFAAIQDKGRLRPSHPGFDDVLDSLFGANRNLEPAGYGMP